MSERENLKSMIDTAKRSMSMLDMQLREMQVLSGSEAEQVAFDDNHDQPFFYGMLGPDGLPGLSMGETDVGIPAPAAPDWKSALAEPFIFTGFVNLQADAPFIWTHVLACQAFPEQDIGTSQVITSPDTVPFNSIQGTGAVPGNDNQGNTSFPIVELGFVDDASGRILFQGNRQLEQGQLMPGEMFNTVSLFPERFGQTNFSGSNSPGHGPRMTARLPCEVVLPANCALRVMAKPSFFNFQLNTITRVRASRLYVTLVGRKIYGD